MTRQSDGCLFPWDGLVAEYAGDATRQFLHGERLRNHLGTVREVAVSQRRVLGVPGHEQHLEVRALDDCGVVHLPPVHDRQAHVRHEQVNALRPFRAAAEELAARTEWPALYDAARLAANEVPVAAVQYYDDPYVDLDLALDTAGRVGNVQVWVTNEYLHDGLRVHGDQILPKPVDLAAGRWTVTGR